MIQQANGKPEQAINLTPSPRSGLPPPVHSRWGKGQSGNPEGRKPVTEAYKRKLADQARADKLAERMLQAVEIYGSVAAMKEITERVEGKVAQEVVSTNIHYLIFEEIDEGE